MKPSGLVVIVIVCGSALRADNATRLLDHAQRNPRFAPSSSVQPVKRTPLLVETIQRKRVVPPIVEKEHTVLREQRAAIAVAEKTTKQVLDKVARPLEIRRSQKSRLDGQRAVFSTTGNRATAPIAAKYQASLAAATASNMARVPAVSSATKPTINRFVLRKNGGESAGSPLRVTVTPAAGGSPIRK